MDSTAQRTTLPPPTLAREKPHRTEPTDGAECAQRGERFEGLATRSRRRFDDLF